ncbi:MAG TPA: hypothetical protein VLE95_04530 [Chlamydiales bacterium]|nr:hypothetical protein [Chlamydiales bacterium]
MSTPRIPPPSRSGEPDKTTPTPHRKLEKVEKISEVDQDESKAKKFRQFVDEPDSKKKKDAASLPTPLAALFASDESVSSVEKLEKDTAINPSYSLSPSAMLHELAPEDQDEKNSLPQSDDFWKNIDEPVNAASPPVASRMEETPRSASRVFAKKDEKEEKLKKPPDEFALEEETHQKEKREAEQEQKIFAQFQSPAITPLSDAVIAAAATATNAATPYLGKETLSLYFHMIGTITAMASPQGNSRTEFILNAPAFAGSKFFGSSITIERFSTAPYQFNIQLTGSNEAVNLFNQNIPNLMAAFREGKFSFTVNRIDAVYEVPLIRRKESSKDAGAQGF